METNKNFINAILEERQRLLKNSYPEYTVGLGKNFVIKCKNNAKEVMDLSREVLLIINKEYDIYSKETWNKSDYWKYKLPQKFIDGFEINNKVNNCWSFFKKTDKEKWSFEDWIFLMEPIDRMWFWWGATLIDSMEKDYFIFSAKVLDDPFLSGTLRWLFLASGALEVIDEDDL
ncbi:hypothetical protein Q7506_11120 [Glaesserella parasuis]|uniref:hypothetical protein n=1 Tax=Glaesserella parasuis TaxID=738 RepID=UPI0003AC3A2F|nr:hypothetical protein [Glaesserella parasuis]ATW43528.1 hypothetical protein A2U20_06855 [Glaesserella parasuis D74]EQA10469.1 hypothetical protein HPSD74_0819 [Glaesserella parasuis D74]MDD2173636.1 hypothetical protein [Glaesserella parasuis]MDG6472459.1 hypothetical protein [Glaesserella parasuis]MDO9732485.1 hypothetical protein [Glaesserella parasuis]